MNRIPASLLILVLGSPAFAQRDAKIPDPDPEIERKSFLVAPGFEVTLWAADPLLAKPIQMNWDPQGRLWVATSEVYPQIEPGQKANDKVIILEDTTGAGKADKTTVFADGLLIPTGIAPGDGGAYVANSTEIVHLSASKPGGKADKSRVVLSGFGTEDTHHIIHTFRWGPDGCLYFNQSIYIHSHIETPAGVKRLNAGGIWRFRPETNDLSVFARGWVNAWGHAFDKYGQSLVTDGAGGEGINHAIPGSYFMESKGPNAGRILHGLNPGSPKYCGLEILSGRHLPDDWQGDLITNDFRGHRVCRFKLQDDGSTFASREMPELLKTTHPAFRPIDVKMGPDGAIYIADWYNPIIQHGEVDFRDPRRDHVHGRIWRVAAKGRPLVTNGNLATATIPQLLDSLKAPEDWTRQQAKRMLKERGAKDVLPELANWVAKLDPKSPAIDAHRLEALWLYQALDTPEPGLLTMLLNGKDFQARAAACRVVGAWAGLTTQDVVRLWFDPDRMTPFGISVDDATKVLANQGWVARARLQTKGAVGVVFDFAEAKNLEETMRTTIEAGGHDIPLSTLAVAEHGRQQPTGGDPLAQLAERAKDEHPRVRLEAVRALAGLSSSKAAEAALSALDKPLDRVLDYGLWLTVRELEPRWLPAFRFGTVNFNGDAKKIAFALEAVGSKDVVEPLIKLIESGKVSKDESHTLYLLLARIGGPEELGRVLDRAAREQDLLKNRRTELTQAVEDAVRLRKVGPPQTMPSFPMLLASPEKTARAPAARLIGLWKVEAMRPRLESLGKLPETAIPAEAAAALEGIALFGDEKAKGFVSSLCSVDAKPAVRRMAVVALAGIDTAAAAAKAAEYLQSADGSDNAPELFAAFLAKRGAPTVLAKALAGKTLPPDVAKVGLRAVRASAQNVPDLVAALTKAGNLAAAKPYPTDTQVKQLTAEVITHGDPVRGESVFRKNENQCFNCHAIGGAGGRVGPDLTSIGASAQIDYLVDSILNPNKAVKEGYHAVKVTTAGGKVIQGVPVREANGELILRDADDKEVKIPLNQIDEKVPTRSLMADGLADPLTKQELLDLVRFLSELGKVGPYGPSTARVVRRWQTVDGGNANAEKMRRTRATAVAEPDESFLWLPAYSTVAGNLPLADLPKITVWNNTAAQSVVRCQLDVTTAGKVRLKLNDESGLAVHLGPSPVEAKTTIDLDLPVGVQTITLIVDRSVRTKDLRMELDDVPGSTVRVAIVNGK